MSARFSAVDLIGQEDICEDGAFVERERIFGRIVDVDANDVTGENIARELEASCRESEAVSESGCQGCFANARDVFDEEMTA